jgi:hypothetical protein
LLWVVLCDVRGHCDELITRPGESYRLWCVLVCDLEILWMRRPWPTGGCRAKNKQTFIFLYYNPYGRCTTWFKTLFPRTSGLHFLPIRKVVGINTNCNLFLFNPWELISIVFNTS